jgi:hypothetical protein
MRILLKSALALYLCLKTLENLTHILERFDPITLQEMDGVELMNRMDTKFILHMSTLVAILKQLPSSYKVLEVNGTRASKYETLYFDTPDFLFYRRHHSGKKNRIKIRKRSYLESNLTYLEVKFKSNKDRTVKDRTKVPSMAPELEERSASFIEQETGLHADFEPKLNNTFSRTTFVFPEGPERITIDTDLSFFFNEKIIELNDVVIVEVKQSNQNRKSYFMQCLKEQHIRPESFSKYCLGVAMLYENVKHNAFKEKLMKINRIQHGSID